MPKLTTIKTGLASVARPLSPLADPTANRDQTRTTTEPWRAWYKTARWQKLRWSILVRDLFTCGWKGCGLTTHVTSQLVVHHKIRHRGNAHLFWSEANLMTVCKACHDGPIQAEEKGRVGGGRLSLKRSGF